MYLVQIISFQNSCRKEINRKLSLGWKKYWSSSFSEAVCQILKTLTINKCIIPCMTYEAQTSTLLKKDINKLIVTQRAMKHMLCLSFWDGIRNITIRENKNVDHI